MEAKVFKLICEGLSNAEIGEAHFITERTVKFHVTRILAKAGVETRAQLIVQHYKSELGIETPRVFAPGELPTGGVPA